MANYVSRRLAAAGLLAALAPLDAARAQPYPNDTLIVPGVRVGGVYLGMSLGEVYRLLGEPQSSMRGYYDFGNLSVSGFERAELIEAGAGYSTQEGITRGSSQLALMAQRPRYYRRTELSPDPNGYEHYFYEDGLKVHVGSGSVRLLVVFDRRTLRQYAGEAGDYVCWRMINGTVTNQGDDFCRRTRR